MNKIILMGRLTRDPDIRMSRGDAPVKVAKYSLAVDRKKETGDGIKADFFNMTAFERNADFAEKYLTKGMKILVTGYVRTGYYERMGERIPTFDVMVLEQEFAEGKRKEGKKPAAASNVPADSGGFMNIPEDLQGLPFL